MNCPSVKQFHIYEELSLFSKVLISILVDPVSVK